MASILQQILEKAGKTQSAGMSKEQADSIVGSYVKPQPQYVPPKPIPQTPNPFRAPVLFREADRKNLAENASLRPSSMPGVGLSFVPDTSLAQKNDADIKTNIALTKASEKSGNLPTLQRILAAADSGAESAIGGGLNALQTAVQFAGDKLGKAFGTEQALADPKNQETLKMLAKGGALGNGGTVNTPAVLTPDKLMKSAQTKSAAALEDTSGVGKFALEGISAATNMATGAATSLFTGIPFTAQMGIQGGGNAAYDAKQQGKTIDQQLTYGLTTGIATGLIESIGGIGASQATKAAANKVASSLLAKLPTTIANWMNTTGAKIGGKIISNAISEAGEEAAQYNVDLVLQKLTLDNDVPFDIKQMAYQALQGGVLGGIFGGGTSVANAIANPQSDTPKAITPPTTQTQNTVLNNNSNTTDSAVTSPQAPQSISNTQGIQTPTTQSNAVQAIAEGQNGASDKSIALENETDKLNIKLPKEIKIGTAAPKGDIPEGQVERGFTRNVRTDEAMDADIRNTFDVSPESYTRLSNKVTLATAQAEFDKGVDVALSELNKRIGAGKISPSDVPLARMIANALVKQGNIDGARAVISDVAVLETEAGRIGQAARILRNADPISVENTVQKAIDKINEELKNRGSKYRVALTQEELDLIRDTDFSQEGAFESVYEKIAKRIGTEMPSTLWEKLTEIRRIAMLLNPKTQLRNIVGNTPLLAMRKGSEKLAGGIQDILVKMGALDKAKQTRTFSISAESKTLAKKLFDLNKEVLVNGSDKWDMNTLIRQYRKYFGKSMAGKAVDATRAFTYNLLQKGDFPFLKSAFVDNAAQYIEAQGYKSIDEIPVGVAEKATQNALEATFRDVSVLARVLNQAKAKGGFGGAALDVLFPFTTTPINIARRTYQYSPLGMISVVKDIMSHQDGTKIIDDLTKTLTGTGVVALGFLLKSLGAITGAADKDKDKANFDKATGKSPYSFAGKVSYDWLQPAGSLLAMGAAAYDAASTQEGIVDKITGTLTASGDAYLNMTFFQSVIDLFKGYGSPTENVLTTVATSGLSQFTPSLFGGLARVIDPTVRSQQTGGNVLQNAFAGAQAKTPFASASLPPSVNVKGEENKRIDNSFLRAFQEVLNPASINTNKATPIDTLISNVFTATNDKGVFPKTAPNDVGGVKLTGEEKAQFQTTLGKTTYAILQQEINSKSFNAMSDTQKAAVIKEIIEYANDTAKREYAKSNGKEYTSSYDDETKIDDLGTYFVYKQAYGDTGAENQKARIALLSDTSIKADQIGLIYDSLFSDSYYDKYEEFGQAVKIPAKTFVNLMQTYSKKDDMIAGAEKAKLSKEQTNALLIAKDWKPI